MEKNDDTDQDVVEHPKYIVITSSWRDYLILPIKEAMEFIRLRSMAIRIEGDLKSTRDQPLRIGPNDAEVTISYMTQTKLKQLKMESIVEQNGEQNG